MMSSLFLCSFWWHHLISHDVILVSVLILMTSFDGVCFTWCHPSFCVQINVSFRGFPTRMVYLCDISCLRYTILVGNPRSDDIIWWCLFHMSSFFLFSGQCFIWLHHESPVNREGGAQDEGWVTHQWVQLSECPTDYACIELWVLTSFDQNLVFFFSTGKKQTYKQTNKQTQTIKQSEKKRIKKKCFCVWLP